MAVEGGKLLELVNEVINQSTKFEIELRETKDKSDEAKAETSEVCRRLTKALPQLQIKLKDSHIHTQDFLIHVTDDDKDEVFDGITRNKKCRKVPKRKENKGDSGVYSADSKSIDSKESRRVGMNLEDAFASEEQTGATYRASSTISSAGSIISQCSSDLGQINLDNASEQTYQSADNSWQPNFSPKPSENSIDSIEDNSAYH